MNSKLVAYLLAGWLVVEVVAFVLVVQILGVVAAVVLGVGTTLLGLADVRRLWAYIKIRLARSKENKPSGNVVDGGLQALGAALLILPGFASDLVGLALKAPSIRASVADKLRRREAERARMIDLKPNEWKKIDSGKRRSQPKKPPPQAPETAAPDRGQL